MGRSMDDTALVEVLEVSTEMEALAIQSFLQSRGIDAALRSRQIPMFDGIARVFNPAWGSVLVNGPDREEAEKLIRGYLETIDNPDDDGPEG